MKRILLILVALIFTTQIKAQTPVLHIYGGKSHKYYLGCLNCNKNDENSIWNKYGKHGSKYNDYSIWNKNGTYGGSYSDFSPFNNYASYPPAIVDKKGNFYGYLTINKHKSKRADFNLALIIYESYEDIRDDVSEWYSKIFDNDFKLEMEEPSSNRERYETTKPEFVEDFLYEPDWDLTLKVLKHKNEQFEKTSKQREKIFNENFNKAKESYNQKNYNKTIYYVQLALKTNYDNAEIYLLAGLSYYNLRNYDEALM